jgi:multiple sugar transport system permease protein
MPTLVPLVASVILWKWLLNPDFGIVNQWLRGLGADPPGWFGERAWAIPTLILMRLWTSIGGTQMIIFLAGLQGIPRNFTTRRRLMAPTVGSGCAMSPFRC